MLEPESCNCFGSWLYLDSEHSVTNPTTTQPPWEPLARRVWGGWLALPMGKIVVPTFIDDVASIARPLVDWSSFRTRGDVCLTFRVRGERRREAWIREGMKQKEPTLKKCRKLSWQLWVIFKNRWHGLTCAPTSSADTTLVQRLADR